MSFYPLFHSWGRGEKERWKRIRLSLWAYAYEIACKPIVSDEKFDKLAQSIDLTVTTSRPDLDEWWRKEFTPYTGQWIHKHPELGLIEKIYKRFK